MAEKQSSGNALSEAAAAYMEAHSEEKFSLEQMAKALFVNGSYLLRTFKRTTGMTPLVYHHMIRVRRAKELLSGTDQTISEIGKAVGYVSASHFAHIFQKTTGCSPTEYRHLHQKCDQERTDP